MEMSNCTLLYYLNCIPNYIYNRDIDAVKELLCNFEHFISRAERRVSYLKSYMTLNLKTFKRKFIDSLSI